MQNNLVKMEEWIPLMLPGMVLLEQNNVSIPSIINWFGKRKKIKHLIVNFSDYKEEINPRLFIIQQLCKKYSLRSFMTTLTPGAWNYLHVFQRMIQKLSKGGKWIIFEIKGISTISDLDSMAIIVCSLLKASREKKNYMVLCNGVGDHLEKLIKIDRGQSISVIHPIT